MLCKLHELLFFVEAPEEDYDPRSLFDRLEANRVKKQEEFDEAHRLSMYLWFYMHSVN